MATPFINPKNAKKITINQVKTALKNGKSCKTLDREYNNSNALGYAVMFSHNVEIVKLLLDTDVDIYEQNNLGYDIFSQACGSYKNIEMIKFLYEHMAKSSTPEKIKAYLNTGDDNYGITLLDTVCNSNTFDEVEFLLKKGATPNLRDVNATPLILAGHYNPDPKVIDILMEYGASVDERNLENEYTGLHMACYENNLDVITALIKHGANVNALNRQGMTPLMYLVKNLTCSKRTFMTSIAHAIKTDIPRTSDEAVAIVKLLLKNGADIHIQNDEGKTVLMGTAVDRQYGDPKGWPLEDPEIAIRQEILKLLLDHDKVSPYDLKYLKELNSDNYNHLFKTNSKAKAKIKTKTKTKKAPTQKDTIHMKKLYGFIKKHKDRFFRPPALLPEDTIEIAEKQFGFKFDDTLKEFFTYDNNFGSIDLLGITSYLDYDTGLPTSGSYSKLKELKEREEEGDIQLLPSDKVVPIEFLDEWTIVYSFGDQNPVGLYCIDHFDYKKERKTLENYVLAQWKRDLKDMLEEEEDEEEEESAEEVQKVLNKTSNNTSKKTSKTITFNSKNARNITVAKMKKYLDNGGDCNLQQLDDRGFSNELEVSYAVLSRSNVEVIKLLLDSGMDLNLKSKGGLHVFAQACYGYDNLDVIELLYENKAKSCTPAQAKAYINAKDENGSTPVVSASYLNTFNVVEFLLEKGATIKKSSALFTPSAYNPDPKVIDILIKHGAKVNVQGNDFYKHTALHDACTHNNADIIATLIKHGADVNNQDTVGMTPLMWTVRHLKCSQRQFKTRDIKGIDTERVLRTHEESLAIVKSFLENGADVRIRDHHDNPALISWNTPNAHTTNYENNTVLMWTAIDHHLGGEKIEGSELETRQEIVKMILEYGGEPSVEELQYIDDLNSDNYNHLFASYPRTKAKKSLVKNKTISKENKRSGIRIEDLAHLKKDPKNYTESDIKKNLKMVINYLNARTITLKQLKKDLKKALKTQEDKKGYLYDLLCVAVAYTKNVEIVKFLLDTELIKSEFNVDTEIELYQADYHGLNLLGIACRTYSNIDVLKCVYEHVEKSCTPPEANYYINYNSPLNTACYANTFDEIEFLLKKGAEIIIRDNDKPIIFAAAEGNSDPKVIDLLMEHGASVNDVWTRGTRRVAKFNSLNLACIRNHFDVIVHLIKLGADVNNQNEDGMTPLMTILNKLSYYAKTYEKYSVHRSYYMIGRGTERTTDETLTIVKLLLEHGADIHIKDNNKQTALMWAVIDMVRDEDKIVKPSEIKTRQEVVKLLLEHAEPSRAELKYMDKLNSDNYNYLFASYPRT